MESRPEGPIELFLVSRLSFDFPILLFEKQTKTDEHHDILRLPFQEHAIIELRFTSSQV